jgi:hypothetical protein
MEGDTEYRKLTAAAPRMDSPPSVRYTGTISP